MCIRDRDYTGRGFYSMSSNEDYPTAAELIDYAYGRYNICLLYTSR